MEKRAAAVNPRELQSRPDAEAGLAFFKRRAGQGPTADRLSASAGGVRCALRVLDYTRATAKTDAEDKVIVERYVGTLASSLLEPALEMTDGTIPAGPGREAYCGLVVAKAALRANGFLDIETKKAEYLERLNRVVTALAGAAVPRRGRPGQGGPAEPGPGGGPGVSGVIFPAPVQSTGRRSLHGERTGVGLEATQRPTPEAAVGCDKAQAITGQPRPRRRREQNRAGRPVHCPTPAARSTKPRRVTSPPWPNIQEGLGLTGRRRCGMSCSPGAGTCSAAANAFADRPGHVTRQAILDRCRGSD